MEQVTNLYADYLPLISAFAFLTLVFPFGALFAVIYFCPATYWLEDKPKKRQPILGLIRNIFACVLIIFGVVLLFLPGQGTLLILVGLGISSLPFRQKVIAKILKSSKVRRFLNRRRSAFGKDPFVWPSDIEA